VRNCWGGILRLITRRTSTEQAEDPRDQIDVYVTDLPFVRGRPVASPHHHLLGERE